MTYPTGMRSAVCIAALIAGSAAQADVTAAQVWEDWKAQMSLYGEDSLTIGAEETSSGVVTIRDLSLRTTDDEVTAEISVGTITFNEQSDGTVRVTMDDSYPMVITGEDGVVVTLAVTQQNMDMIVSGDPDAMNYAITADQYGIALQDVVDGDITFTGDAQVMVNDIDMRYQTETGDLREISYNGTIGSVDLLVDFQIPGGNGEYVTAGGKMTAIAAQAEMSVPADADLNDPDTLIVDGFAIAGGYTIDRSDFVFDINADGDQASGSITVGSSTLTGEMNNSTVGYTSSTNDVAMNIVSGDFPLPIELSLAQYGVNVLFPTAASEEASDFAFGFDLVDLSISDALWDLFDAGKVLPRDPATIQLALSGRGKALFDMFDPEQQDAMNSAEMPYELESVTLERLNVNAAGAALVGSGAFTFDNSDMDSFAPLPRPEGSATIEITGFNALLDNLVAMGLVPEQDVMGARMMVGMFARSTGDDQMETSVEVLPNGQVNVNGNRVR
ncbi:hypothetical protein SAMN05421665_2456 [Yoonia rosea]|uniref:DUF2125 domain-containing protein n=1 Tax=Yoonia rosea TaxID=287098 RepID=A0A1R3XCQ1_9RHOB|nr:DUF2125 domain-containing protein [Yoonia rosea]SIT87575.1 hypothetical protein SAMN05421665_2456 [Yoonia rosea]